MFYSNTISTGFSCKKQKNDNATPPSPVPTFLRKVLSVFVLGLCSDRYIHFTQIEITFWFSGCFIEILKLT